LTVVDGKSQKYSKIIRNDGRPDDLRSGEVIKAPFNSGKAYEAYIRHRAAAGLSTEGQ